MKKVIMCATMVLAIICSRDCFALGLPYLESYTTGTIMGESIHIRPNGTTQEVFIDWIVSDHDLLTAAVTEGDFHFSTIIDGSAGIKGNKTIYDGSKYYYYYQIENDLVHNYDVLNTLSLDIDPDLILSAGYITGLDIDVDLIETHDLLGEEENVTGTIVDADMSKFVPVGLVPHQNWEFYFGLTFGAESTILFFTSDAPPRYSASSLLAGHRSYDGELPIPSIPEPLTMVLLGFGSLVVYIRKRLVF